MSRRFYRNCVVITAVACALAGRLHAATFTYDWHAMTVGDTKWSTGMNWVGNAAPPSNVATELVFSLPITSINGAGTNQDIVNPFVLRGISYDANDAVSIRITGNALKFDNANKYINNFNSSAHQINVPITLAGNNDLIFGGNAGAGAVIITGAIDGVPGITVNHTGAGSALDLRSANAFQGGVTLTSGYLRVGDNAALGTGDLKINGGGISASPSAAASPSNAYQINQNFIVAPSNVTTNKLKLTGDGVVSGLRTVTIDSPREVLELSGALTAANATDGLRFVKGQNGANPIFQKKKGQLPIQLTNSMATLSGTSPDFSGKLEAVGVTLKVTGMVGSQNNVMAGCNIGDPNAQNPSNTALIARDTKFWCNLNKIKIINSKKNQTSTIWQNGESPGVATISGGGGFDMDSMAGFGIFVDGPTPGNNPGNYSQLVMDDNGAITLDHDVPSATRPVLFPSVSDSYVPVIGERYRIIDQTSSLAPRLDSNDNLFQVDDPSEILANGGTPGDPTLYDHTIFTEGDGMIWQIRYGLIPGVDAAATSADTNDVFLQVIDVPEPASAALLAGALLFAAVQDRGTRGSP